MHKLTKINQSKWPTESQKVQENLCIIFTLTVGISMHVCMYVPKTDKYVCTYVCTYIRTYGELKHSKCSRGEQKKTYKASLKTSLKGFSFDPTNWESLASDRST